MRIPQDPTSSIRWLAVYNAGATPVPPYGVMKSNGLNSEKEYIVTQPDGDSLTEVLINGPVSIPALTSSEGHRTEPGKVLIESADGTPAQGDNYGTAAGTWKLRKGKTGFRVIGAGYDANTAEMTFLGVAFKELSAGGGATAFSGCRVNRQGSSEDLGQTTDSPVHFDTQDWDTDAYWAVGVGSGAPFTAPVDGYYLVGASLALSFSSGPLFNAKQGAVIFLLKNADSPAFAFQQCERFDNNDTSEGSVTGMVHLTAGDTVSVHVGWTIGASGNSLLVFGSGFSSFWIARMG